jgi:hypothetical protein
VTSTLYPRASMSGMRTCGNNVEVASPAATTTLSALTSRSESMRWCSRMLTRSTASFRIVVPAPRLT